MRKLIVASALFWTLPATADAPQAVWINAAGTFDIDLVNSGSFAATGAIQDSGSYIDYPIFQGQAILVTRILSTAAGDYIEISINGNHVSGSEVPPTWCPAPDAVPDTFVVAEIGNWKVASGTGHYASLKGTGAWATWVTVDAVTFQPISSQECLLGRVQ